MEPPHLLGLPKLNREDTWLAPKANTNGVVIKSALDAANKQNDKKKRRKNLRRKLLSFA